MALTRIGALKIAAKKTGLSFEQYQDKLAAGLKWCGIGHHFVPLSEFGMNKLKSDGLQPYCRACTHVKERKSTKGRISPMRGKSPNLETRQKMAEAHLGALNHRWKGGYSAGKPITDGILARRAVNHAIEAGKISKVTSQFCGCGKPATRYHHHLGYTREHWMDVTPLCASCNAQSIHFPETLICPVCNLSFISTRPHQRYCSPECFSKATQTRERERSRRRRHPIL